MNNIYKVHLDDLPLFCQELAKSFSFGDCVCLTGQMGAGKTTLSYFLVQAWLGETVQGFASPTFTIMNQYVSEAGRIVNHVDLYRLTSFAAFADLDLILEWDQPNTLTLVEWGEKFVELQPHFTHTIHITLDPHQDELRKIVVSAKP